MLDPRLFNAASYAQDVVDYNALVTEGARQLPWPPASAAAFRAMVPEMIAAQSPDGVVYRSAEAREIAIPVPGGEIIGRVLEAPAPTGLYVHVHGGGWTIGAADLQDATLERIVRETGQTVVSLEYRMAPEHPFPGPLDDCEAGTRRLADRAEQDFGASVLTIGGESAGANLALAVALRLRDRPAARPLAALNLLYGAYDLGLTPSARGWGDRGGVLSTAMLAWFYEQYVPDPAARQDPEVSPLYARLQGLPPALLTVGTEDPLRDDTLFLHTRLVAAGVVSELQVVPGAGHSFDSAPISVAGPANARVSEFLSGALPVYTSNQVS